MFFKITLAKLLMQIPYLLERACLPRISTLQTPPLHSPPPPHNPFLFDVKYFMSTFLE